MKNFLFGIGASFLLAPCLALAGICERTPEIVEQLSLWAQKPCESITEEDLKVVFKLDLEQQSSPQALKAGDFKGLVNLKRASISVDSLESLPNELFCDLPNLEKIDIKFTSLRNLPPKVFCASSSLKNLNIQGNVGLDKLPEGIFDGLIGLEQLTVESNYSKKIPEIPSNSSRDLLSLKKLSINGKRGFLDPLFFNNLRSLEEVFINDEILQELPMGVFSNNPSLKILELNQFKNGVFPPKFFVGMKKLLALIISNGEFHSLQSDFFDGLNLIVLNMSGTRVETPLPNDLLRGMLSLRMIDLNSSKVPGIPAGFFRGAPNLVEINMDFMDLKSLPDRLFEGLNELETVNINYNSFVDLSPNVFSGINLNKIKTINISREGLTDASVEKLKNALGEKIVFN